MKMDYTKLLILLLGSFVVQPFLEAAAFTALPQDVRRIELLDVLAASQSATSEVYPDADTIILDSVLYETYNPDGTSTVYDDTYTKILTEKGRRSESTATLGFNAFYSDVEISAAQIIKPDGSVIDIDLERNSKVSIDSGMMSSNIYDPNDKKLAVAYPGLEPGDIARLAIVKHEKKTRVPGVWSDYQTFEAFDPIIRYTYAVSSPSANPIRRSALRDEVVGTLISQKDVPLDGGERILHIWNFENVPQAFGEPSMPPMHTVCQRLLLSTVADWRDLSRWYWELSKPHLDAVSDEMRKTVGEISSGIADENEKIWRIFTWVSQNVRYMGVTTENEAPGYEPHDASETFGRRHGVCRDKAALLVSMLRLAGIDAFPVLIHVGEKRDPEVPMTFFNHAIVGVRDADGEYTLMDATNENTADLLPAYLAGKSYLVATPEGEMLRTSPEVPAAANMLFATSKAKVAADGKISLSSKFDFTGLNDGVYRGAFARMPAENRRKFLESLVRNTIPGATLESFAIVPANLQDTDTPLSISLTAVAPNFAAAGREATVFDIPRFTSSIGYLNYVISDTGLLERRYPLETEDACGVEENFEIEFESLGKPIALPENVSFKTNGITYSQKVYIKSNPDNDHSVVSSFRRLEFNLTSYPPDLYKAFKDTLHRVETFTGQIAAFDPSPTPEELAADSQILSTETVIDITSPTSWSRTVTTVRKILTYAGRRSFSELKIPYNPAWQKVEILKAAVSNGDSEQEVAASEINEMDASWVASAPRYPAAKTLVASLPSVETGSFITTSYRITQTNAPFFSHLHIFNGTTPRNLDGLKIYFHGEAADALRIIIAKTAGSSNDNDDDAPYADDDMEEDFLEQAYRNVFLVSGNEDLTLTHKTLPDGTILITVAAFSPPTLPRETSLPDPSRYAITLDISLGDWGDYSATLKKAVAEATSPANTVNCAELAASLCEGLTSTADKITAIRDYVARNIRLAGPSFITMPLAPSPADVTLSDGYGNLLDRAILLSALLFDAGIDNNIVFAADEEFETCSNNDLSRQLLLPHTGTFDYPLVEIPPDDDGNEMPPIYLNDTDQYATLGMTPHYNHLALTTLKDDPDCELLEDFIGEDVPSFEAFDAPIKPLFVADDYLPATTTHTEITLDDDGNALVKVGKTFRGTGADAIRKQFSEMTPELLTRHHQELAGEISVSAQPCGEFIISTNTLPYEIEYSASVPGLAKRTGNVFSLEVPHISSISPFDASKRVLPFELLRQSVQIDRIDIYLPPAASRIISKPSSIDWNCRATGLGGFSRICDIDFDKEKECIAYRELQLQPLREYATFGPEFYAMLQEMDRRLMLKEANLFVYEIDEETEEEEETNPGRENAEDESD